jgi:hypothetical protein
MLNFSPYAFPYNGLQADIFSNDDVYEIMDAYFFFLVSIFNITEKVQLCSIAPYLVVRPISTCI